MAILGKQKFEKKSNLKLKKQLNLKVSNVTKKKTKVQKATAVDLKGIEQLKEDLKGSKQGLKGQKDLKDDVKGSERGLKGQRDLKEVLTGLKKGLKGRREGAKIVEGSKQAVKDRKEGLKLIKDLKEDLKGSKQVSKGPKQGSKGLKRIKNNAKPLKDQKGPKKGPGKGSNESDEGLEGVEGSGGSKGQPEMVGPSRGHVVKSISGVYRLTEEELRKKNELFDDEHQPVFLQVTCVRVPKTPRRIVRLILPAPIIPKDDHVTLIVPDVVRGRRKSPTRSLEAATSNLTENNCLSLIHSIISLNQIKTEYDQFELKRKLRNSSDFFLVDAKICGHLSHLLGKVFYSKRKFPVPIRMNSKDLKKELLLALRKTGMLVHSFGDTHLAQVGHTGMTEDVLADNIMAACEELKIKYPGGWDNVRAIRIKTEKSPALPIYISLKNKNTVPVPTCEPPRPRSFRELRGTISTVPRPSKISVTPDGSVSVELIRRSRDRATNNPAVDNAP